MSNHPVPKELMCLTLLAEHRLLSVGQLVVLSQKGKRAIQQQLGQFRKIGWVKDVAAPRARGRGRPEELVGLTEKGVDRLRDAGRIERSVPYPDITADAIVCQNHQRLLNWFSIHLIRLERQAPDLSIRLLSATSPFLAKTPDGHPLIRDSVAGEPHADPGTSFIPDAVLAITSRQHDMTLLFFLEVDLGTETLASPHRTSGDIRHKILTYQRYFRSHKYKRYESIFGHALNGFRLLFLAHSPGRAAELCRLVQAMPPSDFIWVTDPIRLFDQGPGAAIWTRGGKDQNPPESILGGSVCPLPSVSV